MKNFDWEDLRHFSALAQTLHLGRAAALLGTSQVTVMRRVKSLERSLSATLFVRRRDGHRLTASGRTLLDISREAEHVLAGVRSAFAADESRARGRVRIMTTEIGANWMLLPRLREFLTEYPEISLEIDASPQAQDLLLDTESLALRFLRPSVGDYVVQRIGAVPFSIFGDRKLLGVGTGAAHAAFASSLPYVGWAGPFAEISLSRWLRDAFSDREAALSTTTFHGHLEAARNSIGVVGLPIFVGGQFPELVELLGFQPAFSLDAWLVVPSQSRRAGKVRAAMKFTLRAARDSLMGKNSK